MKGLVNRGQIKLFPGHLTYMGVHAPVFLMVGTLHLLTIPLQRHHMCADISDTHEIISLKLHTVCKNLHKHVGVFRFESSDSPIMLIQISLHVYLPAAAIVIKHLLSYFAAYEISRYYS
mgnify:CR=1 FL=1